MPGCVQTFADFSEVPSERAPTRAGFCRAVGQGARDPYSIRDANLKLKDFAAELPLLKHAGF